MTDLFPNNCDEIKQISRESLIDLLESDLVPEFLLDWASIQADREIALAMLMNPKTSQQQLETLFKTFDTHFGLDEPSVYSHNLIEEHKELEDALDVLSNIDAHVNWENKELEDNWQEEIIYQIIKLRYCDRDIENYPDNLGRFLSLDFDMIFNQIIHKPEYRLEVKYFFAEAKAFTVAHKSKNIEELEKVLLKKDPIFRFKYAILQNPNLPIETLKTILNKIVEHTDHLRHLNNTIFEQIFKQYPELTKDFFERLYNHAKKDTQKNIWYRDYFLAGYSYTPLNISNKLSQSTDLEVLCRLASNSKSTEEILLELTTKQLNDTDLERLYLSLSSNPNCPNTVLHKINKLSRIEHGDRVKAYQNISALELRIIAKQYDDFKNSYNYKIRIDVARNRNTDIETLEILANDRDWEVRSNVAKNPNTPINILRELAKDESEVRYAILANPNLTKKDFYKLMRDIYGRSNYSLGCLLALLDPNISPKILKENANSLLWNERFVIAIHPKTPKETIQRLSNDGNYYVRAGALECL